MLISCIAAAHQTPHLNQCMHLTFNREWKALRLGVLPYQTVFNVLHDLHSLRMHKMKMHLQGKIKELQLLLFSR